ncbi:MAG: 3-dehydroquinate synthase [Ruminococcus sp.]|nr:3-dehydroquinate synthase [Ruminococcus sp.]
MRTLKVETGRPYDIIIKNGIIDNCGEFIKKVSKAMRVAVISDTNVFPIYGDKVVNSLTNSGYQVYSFTFEAGEKSKNLTTISKMYDFLAENHITRTDLIVALGGGVTGDMAGFAAASYLRGIDFVQIPTSLLAQVDSSVGGKTGVDIGAGKNLVGAFWQPVLVLIDSNTLDTLPPYYFEDGMAEVIKYGCIKDKSLFDKLEKVNAADCIDDIIYNCVAIKRDVVSRDEREKGERALLNFGHTLGHALEKINNFTSLSHGQAVAIGMCMITKASEKAGLTEKGSAKRIENLCKKYNLPTYSEISKTEIARAASSDKKTNGSSIKLALLKEIGESYLEKIEISKLEDFISE